MNEKKDKSQVKEIHRRVRIVSLQRSFSKYFQLVQRYKD